VKPLRFELIDTIRIGELQTGDMARSHNRLLAGGLRIRFKSNIHQNLWWDAYEAGEEILDHLFRLIITNPLERPYRYYRHWQPYSDKQWDSGPGDRIEDFIVITSFELVMRLVPHIVALGNHRLEVEGITPSGGIYFDMMTDDLRNRLDKQEQIRDIIGHRAKPEDLAAYYDQENLICYMQKKVFGRRLMKGDELTAEEEALDKAIHWFRKTGNGYDRALSCLRYSSWAELRSNENWEKLDQEAFSLLLQKLEFVLEEDSSYIRQ